jgi:hypothetical protein
MRKFFVLGLFLSLLLLRLLLGEIFIEIALFGCDDSGTTFDLLLPFLSENNWALRLLFLFVELESIGPQTLAIGYQIFT